MELESLSSYQMSRINELDVKENSPLHYACRYVTYKYGYLCGHHTPKDPFRYTQYKVVCKLLELNGIKVDVEGSDKVINIHDLI